jgi:hypothetical protein
MRVKANIELQVAIDNDLNNLLFERIKASLNTLIRDDCNAHNSGVARLSASGGGTPSFTPSMGDVVTGYVLFLEADKECTVKLDGGSETQTIKPSGSYPGQLWLHGEYTSAPVIANVSTSDVCTLTYCLVGIASEP